MNQDSIALIIFAFIALGAVFAFIFVLGGPQPTGDLAGSNKLGTSWFKTRDAYSACSHGTFCRDGLAPEPTGEYDPLMELYHCRCMGNNDMNPDIDFWRSAYAPG